MKSGKINEKGREGGVLYFDNWLDQGKLIDIIGSAGTIQFGVPHNARVCDTVWDGSWSIRGCHNRLFPSLHRLIYEAHVPSSENGTDITLWRYSDNTFKPHFSSLETWHQLRDRRETVPWSKVVWFSQGIPRYGFITWLAVKNRLSTGDRMHSWGIQHHCTLCGNLMKQETTCFLLVRSAIQFGIMLQVVFMVGEWILIGLPP